MVRPILDKGWEAAGAGGGPTFVIPPLLPGVSDAGIAMIAGLVLFIIPAGRRHGGGFVMGWSTARALPWGILILFGGGLSLAAAIESNGVAELLAHQAALGRGLPALVLVVLITAAVVFFSELASNTATATTLVPILAAMAPGLGLHPCMLVIPATLAASCAFMMPVGTPPNAMVFGTGHVTMSQMVRAGLCLNLIGIVLITLIGSSIVAPLLDLAP
jgi:sodium-dependent dicarboxylate transporter 2/3/5